MNKLTIRVNRLTILRLALFISVAILLGSAVAISRDYQDAWILEGLELPFSLFVVIFAITFFSERKESSLVSLAVLGRIIWLLIPNLKYVWFQGVAQDQFVQYGLASYVVDTGRIATEVSFTSFSYAVAPVFHLLTSIFSVVTGVSVVDSQKFVPILLSPLYPLLTYAIVKKIGLPQKKSILKYALFLVSIPIGGAAIAVGGVTIGILLALMILFLLVALFHTKDQRFLFVCIIFVIALAAAHSATSLLLSVFFVGILLITSVFKRVPPVFKRFQSLKPKFYLRTSVILIIVSISLAWLAFPAYFNFKAIVNGFLVYLPQGTTPTGDQIPSTFFLLLRADPLMAAGTLLVYFDLIPFFLILVVVGLIIMLWKRKELNDVASFLVFFLGLTLAIMIIGAFIQLGPYRALSFVQLLTPIFCGISIFYLGIKMKWVRTILFASIILLASIFFYGCQPLVPSANIVYKDLPSNVPVGYVNSVNSIYQRRVVSFALSNVVDSIIACDEITYNQIAYHVETYNFTSSHVINYWPLEKRQPSREYDLQILHAPGKAGIMGEQADVRSPSVIFQIVNNSSIVYTNGESYMIANYPQK